MTEEEDIRHGADVAREAAKLTGKPLIGHSVMRSLADRAEKVIKEEELIIPMDIYMKKPWE